MSKHSYRNNRDYVGSQMVQYKSIYSGETTKHVIGLRILVTACRVLWQRVVCRCFSTVCSLAHPTFRRNVIPPLSCILPTPCLVLANQTWVLVPSDDGIRDTSSVQSRNRTGWICTIPIISHILNRFRILMFFTKQMYSFISFYNGITQRSAYTRILVFKSGLVYQPSFRFFQASLEKWDPTIIKTLVPNFDEDHRMQRIIMTFLSNDSCSE